MTTTKSTITLTSDDVYAPTLTLVIERGEHSTAETFAGELLDLARQGYATVYTGSFEEQVLDLYEYAFGKRQETAMAESEYDMGYRIGVEAGKKHTPGVLGFQRVTIPEDQSPIAGDVIVTLGGLDMETHAIQPLIVDRPVLDTLDGHLAYLEDSDV